MKSSSTLQVFNSQIRWNTSNPSSFFPVQSSPSTSTSSSPIPIQPKPHTSLWFTARPSLNSTLTTLTSTLTQSKSHLFDSGILTSISAIPSPGELAVYATGEERLRKWKNVKQMSAYLKTGTELKSSQYKKLTSLLTSVEGLLPMVELADKLNRETSMSSGGTNVPRINVNVVEAAINGRSLSSEDGADASSGGGGLKTQLSMMLNQFQSPKPVTASGLEFDRIVGQNRHLGKMDDRGRIMAVGRRKESSARVWIIPTILSSSSATATATSTPSTTLDENQIPGSILINTLSLPTYFPLPSQRATLLEPLSLTGTLGSFNIFVIAKGGGLSAQSDAAAMGIARCLAEFERVEVSAGRVEEGGYGWREGLKKAKLLERDPRMVERKKTGQLKARKKRAWVKR